ncbi:MAG: hypothetical protein ACRDWY_15220 [Actinomycetes bacterium]
MGVIRGPRHLRWAALVAMPLALCACTVPIGGVTGITVDADGSPVAVVAVCEGQIDGVTVYAGQGEGGKDFGTWTARTPIRREGRLPMAAPSSGWATDTPLAPLKARTTYTVYGWTTDNNWSTGSVSFTLAELQDLDPGQVRYEAYDEGTDRWTHPKATEAHFRDRACAESRQQRG